DRSLRGDASFDAQFNHRGKKPSGAPLLLGTLHTRGRGNAMRSPVYAEPGRSQPVVATSSPRISGQVTDRGGPSVVGHHNFGGVFGEERAAPDANHPSRPAPISRARLA